MNPCEYKPSPRKLKKSRPGSTTLWGIIVLAVLLKEQKSFVNASVFNTKRRVHAFTNQILFMVIMKLYAQIIRVMTLKRISASRDGSPKVTSAYQHALTLDKE